MGLLYIEPLENSEGNAGWATHINIFQDTVASGQFAISLLTAENSVAMDKFFTVETFALQIIRRLLNPQAELLEEPVRNTLLLNCLKRAMHRTGIEIGRNMLTAYVREMDELLSAFMASEMSGEPFFDVSASSQDRLLFEAYAEEYMSAMHSLRERGYFDAYGAVREAITLIPSSDITFSHVHIWNIPFIDDLLCLFIKTLLCVTDVTYHVSISDGGAVASSLASRLGGAFNATPLADAHTRFRDALRLTGYPDMQREVEEVARRVTFSSQKGDVRGIVVAARNIDAYVDMLRSVFQRYGLRSARFPARRYADGRAFVFFDSLLKLAIRKDNTDALLHLLSHEYLRLPVSELAKLRGTAQVSTIEGMFQTLTQSDSEEAKGAAERIREFVKSLPDFSTPAGASRWRDMVLGMYSLVQGAVSSSEAVAECLSFVTGMLHLCDHVEACGLELSGSEFAELMYSFALSSRFSSTEIVDDGLYITDVGLLTFARPSHLFLLGLDSDSFPGNTPSLHFIPSLKSHIRVQLSLRSDGHIRRQLLRYQFLHALSLADQRFISFVYLGADGQRKIPSPFVLELMQKDEDGVSLLQHVEENCRPLSEFFPTGEGVCTPDAERYASINQISDYFNSYTQQRAKRSSDLLSENGMPWDLPLELMRQSDELSFSPSKLNEFRKCGFRYFARFQMKLEPSKEVMAALESGNIIHCALNKIYSSMSIQEICDLDDSNIARLVDEKVRDCLPGKGPPSARYEFFLRSVAAAVASFLIADRERERGRGNTVHALESQFTFSLSSGQTAFTLCGRIDRVEKLADTGYLFLMDYKTGSPSRFKDYFKPKGAINDFEIPVYSLYLASAYGKMAGAFYIYAGAPVSEKKANGFWRKSLSTFLPPELARDISIEEDTLFEERLNSFSEEILRTVSSIVDGRSFTLEPQKDECRTCEYYALCRYRQFRQG
ncbi:MAG: PD-(D/E)XK nuclease family protein [Methanomassiliicoccales archaeon]